MGEGEPFAIAAVVFSRGNCKHANVIISSALQSIVSLAQFLVCLNKSV